jgi:hypothetical protein
VRVCAVAIASQYRVRRIDESLLRKDKCGVGVAGHLLACRARNAELSELDPAPGRQLIGGNPPGIATG